MRQWAIRIILSAAALMVAGSATARPGARLPSKFMRGVNFANVHRFDDGYGSQRSVEQLKKLRDLGVRWIAITPFAFQPKLNSDHLRRFGRTHANGNASHRMHGRREDEKLIKMVAQAHHLGIRVMIKPHIWSRAFRTKGGWHGTIDQNSPAAHQRWWASYQKFAMHYAKLAQRAHADGYCVGTELVKMTGQYPAQWRSLIKKVRKIYKGLVTYAANWGGEYAKIPFWNACDVIGINAYFPLNAKPGASVSTLVQKWQPWIRKVGKIQAKFNKPVVFLEVGYRAVSGTYRKPWIDGHGKVNQQAQARAYKAMFRAWAAKRWWRGAFFWKTFTDPSAIDRDDGGGFRFMDRAAAKVVRHWYADARQTPATSTRPQTGQKTAAGQ